MRPVITKYEYALLCALSYQRKGNKQMYEAYMRYIDGLTVETAGERV